MKRSRFSKEQIIAVLRQHEAGMSTADVCGKHGITSRTFYAWKAKFGGIDVSAGVRDRDFAPIRQCRGQALADGASQTGGEVAVKRLRRAG